MDPVAGAAASEAAAAAIKVDIETYRCAVCYESTRVHHATRLLPRHSPPPSPTTTTTLSSVWFSRKA